MFTLLTSLAEMKRFELLRRFEPTYRISNPDPSTTWVHLQICRFTRRNERTAKSLPLILAPAQEGKPCVARHSKLLCKVILLSNLRRQKQPKLQKTAEMLKARQVIYFTQYTALRVGKAVHAAAFAGASLQFPDRFLL